MGLAANWAQRLAAPEEVNRRLAEFRREGLQFQAMPHVIFRPPHLLCPWAGCGYRIAGIDFQLETVHDPSRYAQLVSGWWHGQGLVGACPGCGRQVLFGMRGKQAVTDAAAGDLTLLPDDWFRHAYIV